MAYCARHKGYFADDEACPFCEQDLGYDDEDENEGPIEEDENEYLDCHMDRNGYCGKAGSEECEFECPYRAAQRRAELSRDGKE